VSANLVNLDTDGWFHPSGDFVLGTGGTERLRVQSGGTVTVSDSAAWRTATATPAIPTNSAGVGQVTVVIGSADGDAVLPSGGSWDWIGIRLLTATGGVQSGASARGVSAGGATVGAGNSGSTWVVFCWRVV
jgi:hypothetical protein